MTELYSVRIRALLLSVLALVLSVSTLSAQWSTLPDLPQQRSYAMSTVLGTDLYVFGGVSPSNAYAQEAWKLDLNNPDAGWASITGMPQNRAGGVAVAHNGKIYVLAGVGVEGSAPVLRTNVLEYDPALNAYTSKAAIPTGVLYTTAALLNGKVYLISGMTLNGTTGVLTSAVQIYDIAGDSWSAGPPVASPYYFAQAVTIGSDIYWYGGRNANSVFTGALKLTGGTGSWTTATPPTTPVFGGAIANIDGKVYLAGGSNGQTAISTAQVYNPSNSQWGAYFPAPAPFFTPAYATDGTSMYVISGATGTDVYKMDVVAPKPVASVSPLTVTAGVAVGGTKQRAITIGNTGMLALTGNVQIPNDAPWLTSNSSSFNVSAGASNQIVLTLNGGSLAPGAYSTNVTVTTNDASNPTFTVAVRMYVAASLVSQQTRVLLEEVTGAWCGPCGAYGTPLVRQLNDTYGENIVTIAYHVRSGGTGDPMATNQTEGMNSWLGASGYVPSATIHRYRYDGERTGLMSEKRNLWEAAVQAVFQAIPTAPVAMEILKYSYDAGTKRVTAQLKLTTADAISLANNGTLRVTAVVKEDSIVYPQNGATEDPYYHVHVARSFYPTAAQGSQGMQVTLPPDATAEGGTVLLPGKEMIVDMSWVVTGVTVPSAADVTFITHLNFGTSPGPVMQAEDVVLTTSIGGPAATLESTPDQLSKNVAAGATAAFNTAVRNLTAAPIEVTFERTNQSLPETWTSQLCVNNDCSDPATASVSTVIPANGSVSFVARINALTPTQTGTVTVRVRTADTTLTYTYSATSGTLGINDEAAETAGLSLTAFPNPTAGATSLEFTSSRGGLATFDVFNAAGTRVLSLPGARYDAGRHTTSLDLSTLPNGVYTIVLGVNGAKVSRTITLVR